MSGSSGAPCGACKFLRRKCVKGCIFAPYFGSEQGAARFAAVHKIFGASNVSKLLLQIPSLRQRCDAVLTISYEAQARLSDPVYGCVATIFALQQQVASLQAELAIVQAQLASKLAVAALNQQHCSGMANNASFYDNSMPSPTAISMSLPNSGSSTSAPLYCRVKEEIANYQGHLQVFDLGMPASIDHVHSAQIDNPIHKSGERSLEDEESSELQALAHALLCRK